MIIFFPRKLLKIGEFLKPKSIQHLLLYSFFYAIAAITYYVALTSGATVSQMAPISRASIITTVLLAAIFLKEKQGLRKKLVSACMVSVGILLLG